MGVYKNTPDTFWERVIKTETCWIWSRGVSGDGYGRFSLYGKSYSTHTLAYKLHHNIPLYTKVFICHTCDNPLCVKPEHLYHGSYKSNSQDTVKRGRAKGLFTQQTPTVFSKGHIPASRVLTKEEAKNIKTDLQTMRQCDVIRKYNVNRDTVRGIVRGSSWAWLEV